MTAITSDAIAPEMGRYFTNRAMALFQFMKYGVLSNRFFRFIEGADGVVKLPKVKVTEMLQRYQPGFQHKGNVHFSQEHIMLQHSKLDFGFNPRDYYDDWFNELQEINFQRSLSGQRRLRAEDHPIVNFIIAKVLEQIIHEEEGTNMARGVYKPPVEGRPGRSIYTVDGLYTVLKRMIRLGKIRVLVHDTTLDKSTAMMFMNEFVEQVDEMYRHEQLKLVTSQAYKTAHDKNFRDAYANGTRERRSSPVDVNRRTWLEDYPTEIYGMPAWSGLNTMLITPESNLIKGFGRYENPVTVKVPRRDIELLGDWRRVYGIGHGAVAWAAGEVVEQPTGVKATGSTGAFALELDEIAEVTDYEYQYSTDASFATGVTTATFNNSTMVDFELPDGGNSYTYKAQENVTAAANTYYVRVRGRITVEGGEDQGTTYAGKWSRIVSVATT